MLQMSRCGHFQAAFLSRRALTLKEIEEIDQLTLKAAEEKEKRSKRKLS